MLVLPFSYFAYNFLLGCVLIFFYLYKERKIVGWAEFLLLLFLPSFGLGSWLFKRQNRNETIANNQNLPQTWHISHKLAWVHGGYMLVLVILGAWVFGLFANYIGIGNDWANHQENATAVSLGLLTDFGIALISFFGLFLYLLVVVILGLFMVVIPFGIAYLVKMQYVKDIDALENLNPIDSANFKELNQENDSN